MQRLDQDLARVAPKRVHPVQQLIDQLIRELAHEVTLPIGAFLAVGRVEDVLLRDEAAATNVVADETRQLAKLAERLRELPSPVKQGGHDQHRRLRLVTPAPPEQLKVGRLSATTSRKRRRASPASAPDAHSRPPTTWRRDAAGTRAPSRRRSCLRRLAVPRAARGRRPPPPARSAVRRSRGRRRAGGRTSDRVEP